MANDIVVELAECIKCKDKAKCINCDELKELKRNIGYAKYNWNVISLCYRAWKDDIFKRKNEEKIKLHQIANVGTNYIDKLRIENHERINRNFGIRDDEKDLLSLLRGKKIIEDDNKSAKISEEMKDKIKEYIVIRVIYGKVKWMKRNKVKDNDGLENILNKMCGNDEWLEQQEKGKQQGYQAYICKFEKYIINYIKKVKIEKERANGKVVYTDYGVIKRFLLGKASEEMGELAVGEEELYYTKVYDIIQKLNCSKLASFNNRNLNILLKYSKILNERILAEKNYRKARELDDLLHGVKKNKIDDNSSDE